MSTLDDIPSMMPSEGVSHPVVARLMLQTNELCGAAGLTEDVRAKITAASWEAGTALLSVWQRASKLKADLAQIMSAPRTGTVLQIPQLRVQVEAHLEDIRRYLNPLKEIVNLVTAPAKLFKEPSCFHLENNPDSLVDWLRAASQTSLDPGAIGLLDQHRSLIKDLMRRRNKVVHPPGLDVSGVLPDVAGGLIRPMWRCEGGPETDLINDLVAHREPLLDFGDGLIVSVLRPKMLPPPVILEEIPPAQRDPAMPLRYRVRAEGLLELARQQGWTG